MNLNKGKKKEENKMVQSKQYFTNYIHDS